MSRSFRKSARPDVQELEPRLAPATLPSGFAQATLADGLAMPTAMDFAPDGRLFVAEQGGTLRVLKDGSLQASPFLSLAVDSRGERGLLGLAFDPDFATDHYLYVYYTTASTPAHNRVSRFTAAGDVALPGSEVVLLDLNPLSQATNHNGGALHFGPDGKLYIAVGENANGANAQSLDNLLGKILRINPDGSIPPDNPFATAATGVNRAIWALGLRNPFTFAFQPGTGRMFINDVGQSSWEEIDEGRPGANYGWPATEGPTSDPRFVGPIFAYPHGPGDERGAGIVGAAFYDPPARQFPPEYLGDYFFADLGNNWIRRLDTATDTVAGFATDLPGVLVDLKVDALGHLVYLTRGSGTNTGAVVRIAYTATTPSAAPVPGDYDGDGRTDLAVYDPQGARFFIRNTRGDQVIPFGAPNGQGLPIAGDYDGDGRTDLAVYDPFGSSFFVRFSGGGGRIIAFGVPNGRGLPVAGDFDGDGRTDLAAYDPVSTNFSISYSGGGGKIFSFGVPNGLGIPIAGDYDGDHRTDVAVYDPAGAIFFIQYSGGGGKILNFGVPNGRGLPIAGDYDGDGKTDLAAYDPASTNFFILQSGGGGKIFPFGVPNGRGLPIAGDYDGDGRTDVVVYDPISSYYFILGSLGGGDIIPFNAGVADFAIPVTASVPPGPRSRAS